MTGFIFVDTSGKAHCTKDEETAKANSKEGLYMKVDIPAKEEITKKYK